LQRITDKEIIRAVLAGDSELFALLIKRYQQDAYRLALSILRNPADAEDAVSEAYCKAFAALAKCQEYTSFKGWLLKITSNCCLDILRRRKREMAEAEPDLQAEAAALHNPLLNLVEEEEKRALWQALDCLHPEDRTALLMKYYQGASYQDIAAALHWPMGTVASRLYRAREKMRQHMVGGKGQ